MGLTDLSTYIPLSEAVTRYAVSLDTLQQAIRAGIVHAVKVNTEIAVADADVAIVAAQVPVETATDELVSINEAARRLGLSPSTVWEWHKKDWLPAQGTGLKRAVLVSLSKASALAALRAEQGLRGRRLIPKGQELEAALTS